MSDRPDWSARARREAAAILSEAVAEPVNAREYQIMVNLVAIGWIQGANYGAHEAVTAMGDAFRELKADLA